MQHFKMYISFKMKKSNIFAPCLAIHCLDNEEYLLTNRAYLVIEYLQKYPKPSLKS